MGEACVCLYYIFKVPPIQYIHCERAHSVFYAPSCLLAPEAATVFTRLCDDDEDDKFTYINPKRDIHIAIYVTYLPLRLTCGMYLCRYVMAFALP